MNSCELLANYPGRTFLAICLVGTFAISLAQIIMAPFAKSTEAKKEVEEQPKKEEKKSEA